MIKALTSARVTISPDHMVYEWVWLKFRKRYVRVRKQVGWSNAVKDGESLVFNNKIVMNPRTKDAFDKFMRNEI